MILVRDGDLSWLANILMAADSHTLNNRKTGLWS